LDLLASGAVQFMAITPRSDPLGWIKVSSGTDSIAAIVRRESDDGGASYAYGVLKGRDPLGYTAHPQARALMNGRFHSADKWLAATIDSDHPDLVRQIPEMFDSPRTGTSVLFAAPGWDFGTASKSGHGGVTRDELVTTMIFAGAGLPKGKTLPYGHSVAVVPTIVHFIRGQKDPAVFRQFDADSLLDNLRAAGEND
jgi:hypothetical protein